MVGVTLKFFLIFSLCCLKVFGQNIDLKSDGIEKDSASIVILKNEFTSYPGKPLVMSLVLPGAGQIYNKSPIWKTASFLGVELATIFALNYFSSEAEKYKEDYQLYADQNWTLSNWVTNHTNFPNQENNGRFWQSFSSLIRLSGTHDLNLIISGDLSEELGLTKVSSDSLDTNPSWAFSDDVVVVKDRHFYENIGKYDQFLGGWDDAGSDWYWEEKDVGDSLEIIIKTPKKQNYINQRYKSNQMLTRVKYSVTTLMFNHVISGIESVFTSQKNAEKNALSNNLSKKDYQINLTYNPLNNSGIGGINFSLQF